jgi:4-amino-4-deoxy-L-arabinose transferase
MLETGDWLVPTLRYQPHWTKPPLTYWAVAGGMELVGRNAWGARLPIALAFVAAVWAVYALGRTLWDPATGLVSAILYATSPFAIGAANIVSTDTPLGLWQLLVVLAYWKAVRSGADRPPRRSRRARPTGPRRAWIFGLWFFAGLAFLTKGPAGLLALLAVFVFHAWMRRRGRDLPRLFAPVGLGLFLVTAFGWYVVVIVRYPEVLGYWLREEMLGRIAVSQIDHNPEWYKPFMLYLPILVFGLGVWTYFWPVFAYRRRADLRLAAARRLFASSEPALFLAVWLFVPLAILFVIRSRLPLYMVPLFPIVVLATARGLVLAWPGCALWRKVVPLACFAALAAIAAKGVIAYLPSDRDERPLAEAVLENATPDTCILVLDRPAKYGLEFYLDGRLEFATMRPQERPADRDAADLVRELATQPRHPRYLVIYKENADEFERLLQEAGLSYTRRPGPGHYGFLILVPPSERSPMIAASPRRAAASF